MCVLAYMLSWLLADAEYTYEEMEREMKSKLMVLATNACSYMHRERYVQCLPISL